MIPAVRARVRLARVVGVASPELRAHVGQIGTVQRVTEQRAGTTALVRFDDGEGYWLGEAEMEAAR